MIKHFIIYTFFLLPLLCHGNIKETFNIFDDNAQKHAAKSMKQSFNKAKTSAFPYVGADCSFSWNGDILHIQGTIASGATPKCAASTQKKPIAAFDQQHDPNHMFMKYLNNQISVGGECKIGRKLYGGLIWETTYTRFIWSNKNGQNQTLLMLIPTGPYVTFVDFLEKASSAEKQDFWKAYKAVSAYCKNDLKRSFPEGVHIGGYGLQSVPHMHFRFFEQSKTLQWNAVKNGATALNTHFAQQNIPQPTTPGQPQPTPGQPQPTPGHPQPTPGHPQPTPGHPQPTPGQPQPTSAPTQQPQPISAPVQQTTSAPTQQPQPISAPVQLRPVLARNERTLSQKLTCKGTIDSVIPGRILSEFDHTVPGNFFFTQHKNGFLSLYNPSAQRRKRRKKPVEFSRNTSSRFALSRQKNHSVSKKQMKTTGGLSTSLKGKMIKHPPQQVDPNVKNKKNTDFLSTFNAIAA